MISHLAALISLFSIFAGLQAQAQTEHAVIRRIAVFPVKAPGEVSAMAEETWWQVREALTENKRFLVASKNFLMQKDVFQARGELKPSDAIILGKLLDANALVVSYVENRRLFMKVYEGEYGRVIWQQEMSLQASLPIAEQLVAAGKKLINDFMAAVPYQGFVVVDSLKGKPVYKQDGVFFVKAEIGLNTTAEKGDKVQFIRLYSDSLKPLFVQGSSTEIFGEGTVVSVENDTITIALDRVTKTEDIRESSLVRLPKELKRLQDAFAIQDKLHGQLGADVVSPEMTAAREEVAERRPLITSLTFIANLAAFLLLAF